MSDLVFPHNPPGQMKLLVVDDSDVVLHALKSFFEDFNFEVTTCTNGLDGLKKAVEIKPNIIFLDLMMPNFDGIKMLQVKKVLVEIKSIPVIVISANADKRNVLAAIEAGADRVISKPLNKETIIRCLTELLGDNLFTKVDKSKTISAADQAEMVSELTKIFLQTVPQKKKQLFQGLQNRDFNTIKTVAHEIKGSGGTIGQHHLSKIASDIENKNAVTDSDWRFVQLQCEQLLQGLNKLEDEYQLSQNGKIN